MNTHVLLKTSTALALVLSLTLAGCSSGGGGHHSASDSSSPDAAAGTAGGNGSGSGDGTGGTGGYRADPATILLLDNGLQLKSHRENDRYSMGLTHALIAAPTQQLNAGARLYAVDDKTRYTVVGDGRTVDIKTDIRALAIESDWRKADDRQLRILSGGLYQGIDGMGANSDDSTYDLDFCGSRACKATRSSTTGKACCRPRCTGPTTPCPTASAPSSAGRTSAAATPTTRPRETKAGASPTRSTTATTGTAAGCASSGPGQDLVQHLAGTRQQPVLRRPRPAPGRCQVLQRCSGSRQGHVR